MSKDKGSGVGKTSVFRKIFSNNSYCWLALACTAGLMLLVFYCFDLFPFGDTTILRMDLYHQYGPLFAEFYDRVTNLKSFIYSWNTGLGTPFLGNFFNYLSSPWAIIMLLLGHKNMPEAIAFMILAKAMFSAFTFTYYLKKSQSRHDYTTAAFGVLYAMCGYFVAYYWNVMWIDAMVYFPLVILGIERIIEKRKPALYIAFLALTLLSNYYMGYMTCIFSVIYFIAFYFSKYEFSALIDNTPYYLDDNGKEKIRFSEKLLGNRFLRSGFTFAFASLAAGCLVAVAIVPTFIILKSCSATSGTFPSDYKIYFTIFDFVANHLSSVEPTIRSSGEDVLPNVYCGIGTLLLVPLYLFSHRISLKEKISSVAVLGIFFFSFNINFANYVWHGFHFPNDLPYRFSFMYSFFLLVLAYKAFCRLDEFTGRQILGVGTAIVFAIVLVQEIGSKNVGDISVLLSLIFAVTYCLVFYVLKDTDRQKSATAVLLLCCVIAEIACSNTDRYSMTQKKTNYCSDYGEFRAVKDELDKRENGDTSYRMELTYNRARMDPSWYGFNGASIFSSMAYEKMSNVQSNLGLYSNYINSYTYYLQTPVYNMMNSIKYVVDNDPAVTVEDDYFTELTTEGKFTAYRNDYYLPIAMLAGKDIGEWYTGYSNPFTVQGDWFEYASGIGDVFSMMTIDDIRYFNIDEITSGLDTGDLYFNKTGDGSGEMTFYLTVPEMRHCYLYVNSTTFDEIVIGRGEDTVTQDTDEPYIYDLGVVMPDEQITVNITVEDSDYGYIDFYPYYVNDEVLNDGYEVLKQNSLKVDSFKETEITGTVTAEEECVLFTSIPYDKGWTVTIDGEKIGEDDYIPVADAYLACKMPAGEHTVRIKYRQRGLLEGACISLATVIALFVVWLIFKKKRGSREERYARMVDKAIADYEAKKAAAETESAPEEVDISDLGDTGEADRVDADDSPADEESDEEENDASESDEDGLCDAEDDGIAGNDGDVAEDSEDGCTAE